MNAGTSDKCTAIHYFLAEWTYAASLFLLVHHPPVPPSPFSLVPLHHTRGELFPGFTGFDTSPRITPASLFFLFSSGAGSRPSLHLCPLLPVFPTFNDLIKNHFVVAHERSCTKTVCCTQVFFGTVASWRKSL